MNARWGAQLPVLTQATSQVLVLGIGNLLWADEGFGVRAAEGLHQRWLLPDNVSVMDGGTQGLYLLDHVCGAQQLLVFDAVDYQMEPGTLRVFRDAEVPVWSDTMMSLHQATFQELLALARLRGRFPKHITLIGVQPVVLDDLGGSLSPLVRARIDEAVEIALAELAAWGFQATPRAVAPAEGLGAAALAMPVYEAGRPPEDAACRVGDSRFMQRPGEEAS
jgi:hydrogenase maturation protease